MMIEWYPTDNNNNYVVILAPFLRNIVLPLENELIKLGRGS
jgi:hypothetical protein